MSSEPESLELGLLSDTCDFIFLNEWADTLGGRTSSIFKGGLHLFRLFYGPFGHFSGGFR